MTGMIFLLLFNIVLAASPCALEGTTAYTGVRIFRSYSFNGKIRKNGYALTVCDLGKVTLDSLIAAKCLFNTTLETPVNQYRVARRWQYLNRHNWFFQGSAIGGIYQLVGNSSDCDKWMPISPITADTHAKWVVNRVNKTVMFYQPIMRTPMISELMFPRSDRWQKFVDPYELY